MDVLLGHIKLITFLNLSYFIMLQKILFFSNNAVMLFFTFYSSIEKQDFHPEIMKLFFLTFFDNCVLSGKSY